MIQIIYKKLKDKFIDVYFAGQHSGNCLAPYVVIKTAGGDKHPDFSTLINYYDLMCYVPANQYSIIEEYKDSIKNIMQELYPMLVHTGYESTSFYDESNKAYMISLQYRNYKKIVR